MNLGEEYRVNVPLLTYGFDDSFLNYFGARELRKWTSDAVVQRPAGVLGHERESVGVSARHPAL
jgi:hypothetical protein